MRHLVLSAAAAFAITAMFAPAQAQDQGTGMNGPVHAGKQCREQGSLSGLYYMTDCPKPKGAAAAAAAVRRGPVAQSAEIQIQTQADADWN
jgi:hypothetical protein